MEIIGNDVGNKLKKVNYKWKDFFDILSIDKKAQEIISMKDFYALSESQRENYNKKVEFISSDGFQEMRKLERNEEFFFKTKGVDDKKIKKDNTQINRLIVKNIIFDKFELIYKKFELLGGDEKQKAILKSCKKNGLNYLEYVLGSNNIDNKKLRECAKVARGETFLFDSSDAHNKCIWLELKQVLKTNDVSVLEGQNYFLQRHISYGADILNISDVLLKGKVFSDFYLSDKGIRYVLSSSRLFDDEFNEFRIKEKIKKGDFSVPNRIKIRQESLHYGDILPSGESEENIKKFLNGKENSMTRALEEYQKKGKEIKEGKGYIDLEELEKWKLRQK